MQPIFKPSRALQRGAVAVASGCIKCCSSTAWLSRHHDGTLLASRTEARRFASSSSSNEATQADKDPEQAPPKTPTPASSADGKDSSVGTPDPAAVEAQRQAARDAIIQEILSRDKVIFELKRQHELSMLRVEQNQARVLKDQEDRGMYYEQNSNVHTFDTISVGLYSQRSTLYHTMNAERLRNFKVFLMVFTTGATSVYFYYRYMINPDWAYVERPMKMIGSRVQAVREQRWKRLSDEEKFEEMRNRDAANTAHNA